MGTWFRDLERYGRFGVYALAVVGGLHVFWLVFLQPRPANSRLTAIPLMERFETTDGDASLRPQNVNGWRYKLVLPVMHLSPIEVNGLLEAALDGFERKPWIRVYAVTPSPVLPDTFWIHTEPRRLDLFRENRTPPPQDEREQTTTASLKGGLHVSKKMRK